MKPRRFEKELEELKALGLDTVNVKCGEFFSIPRVVAFFNKYKGEIYGQEEKDNTNKTEDK